MSVTRSNPNGLKVLIGRLHDLDGVQGKTGWFKSSVYDDETPVAYIAAIHEYGVTINHPGGTRYRIGPDGRAIFVRNDAAGASSLPITKPHTIVIPARPFMRPTIVKKMNEWKNIALQGSKAILAGNATAEKVMNDLVLKAAGDIAKTISQITAPLLKPSTIAARRRSLTDNKTVGALTKPLVHTGMMIDTITGIVERT